MMEWPTCALGELCTITRGSSPRPIADSRYFDGGTISWIKIADATKSGKFLYETKEHVNEFGASFSKRLPPGTLIVATSGTLGYTQILGVEGCAHDGWLILQDLQELDRDYAYYALKTVSQHFFNSAYGAAIQNINTEILRKTEIPYPPLPTQRRIASILSAYDELIENNQRRIRILEDMARSLYREWFVHYRYPGHESVPLVDSSLGQIPQGWEVKVVEDALKRIPSGKKYDQKTASPTGTVPIFDQGKSGIIGYHDDEPGVNATEDNPVIVFANHTCYQRLIHFPFSAIQNVLPFAPNLSLPRNIYWLHWATNGLIAFNDYKGHWPEFIAKELVVPEPEICKRFGEFASPVMRKILQLERAIENLRRTRDLLLPRLLSGQVALSTDTLPSTA